LLRFCKRIYDDSDAIQDRPIHRQGQAEIASVAVAGAALQGSSTILMGDMGSNKEAAAKSKGDIQKRDKNNS
jgi:hypothetical protein